MEATRQAYSPQPEVSLVSDVWDFKEWLLPHMFELHGHSTPHNFKFCIEDETVVMSSRMWCTDAWSQGITLLKVTYSEM